MSAEKPFSRDPKGSDNAAIRVGFVELPGSRRVFNSGSRAWDTRTDDDDPHVPLLAIAGRLGVVNAKSAQVEAAFQLLTWLSDAQMSPQISAASPATTLFRQSHLSRPSRGSRNRFRRRRPAQYGDATEAAFRHEQWLGALRLPGRAEYLAALDEAVRRPSAAKSRRWTPCFRPRANGKRSPSGLASIVSAPPIGTALGFDVPQRA